MGVQSDSILGLGSKTTAVSLTADNQAVTLTDERVLAITSDNTTAANRTFTVSAPAFDGQELFLIMVSGSSTTCQLAVGSTMKISASWEPVQNDTLSLIGYSGVWYERGRADNSP